MLVWAIHRYLKIKARTVLIMLNYRHVQIIIKLMLSGLALSLVTACSVVPYHPDKTTGSTGSYGNVNQSNQSVGREIVQSAKLQMGTPYKFGGNSPKEGFDCSGLASYSYRLNGISIPRSTPDQFKSGQHIDRNKLSAGDLLFFRTMGQSVSHVGIYIDNDTFIHAPNSRKNVQVDSLDSAYYKKRYLGARRYW
ncbi:hypothetical protein LCGC14_1247350 [marine sediment metagenome]|uniref:NlpC/P60 domain-containing protein n=1 Tax=marine sediment metagenome TaxID=412755 RepID=A0A0F9P808_9ZZZZ